ncbi:hypothetical protein [Sphingobacterium siyangense]|uniref:hypothetical protein n=1 Tax=Sphingobacterium siyangense TaxID=459529 RepID=UPI003DA36D0B
MENLTEKETAVVTAIQAGNNTVDSITTTIGFKKASVATLIGSLVKKSIVVKSDDGTVQLIAPATGPQAIISDPQQSIQDPGPNGSEIVTTAPGTENEPENNSPDLENVQAATSHPYTLIIPYLKAGASSTELKLALRTWEKHFPDIRVVVVGDREEWFSDQITYIPHTGHHIIKSCNGCAAPQTEQHPQADSTHKLLTALAIADIDGPIILSNDDIFLLRDITIEDISQGKYFNDLRDADTSKQTRFNRAQIDTADLLEISHMPTIRYGTHTPVLLDPHKVLDIIDRYDATERGLLFTSLYFNNYPPEGQPVKITGGQNDTILASIYRADVPPSVLEEVRNNRIFMNCNDAGWPSVRELLRNDYRTKSRFEI